MIGSGNNTGCHNKSEYPSYPCGFISSMTFIFQVRLQYLMAFSGWIAESIVSCSSNPTKGCTPYLPVKRSTRLFRCCQTRLNKLEVTPVYRVPFRLLAGRYTHGCRSRSAPCYHRWIPAYAGMTLLRVISCLQMDTGWSTQSSEVMSGKRSAPGLTLSSGVYCQFLSSERLSLKFWLSGSSSSARSIASRDDSCRPSCASA